jgi:hypothetical protein
LIIEGLCLAAVQTDVRLHVLSAAVELPVLQCKFLPGLFTHSFLFHQQALPCASVLLLISCASVLLLINSAHQFFCSSVAHQFFCPIPHTYTWDYRQGIEDSSSKASARLKLARKCTTAPIVMEIERCLPILCATCLSHFVPRVVSQCLIIDSRVDHYLAPAILGKSMFYLIGG